MERDQAIGLEITELRLGPPGSKGSREPAMGAAAPATKKRSFAAVAAESEGENEEVVEGPREGKAQKVVGWPPICSYRKNSFMGKAEREGERSMELYVKVSMDGAPFLRKIHLKSHDGYADLSRVLASMFSNLSLGEFVAPTISHSFEEFLDLLKSTDTYYELLKGESNIENIFNCSLIVFAQNAEDDCGNSEYMTVYEDRDGDWMLVGDVPWE
ncbi:hypothetical protein EJ110_NYTH36721 [Nymphaea thermarum]|nr:hypothetical protein EJ110_NYTH36721 [Nymphaea thermarum]